MLQCFELHLVGRYVTSLLPLLWHSCMIPAKKIIMRGPCLFMGRGMTFSVPILRVGKVHFRIVSLFELILTGQLCAYYVLSYFYVLPLIFGNFIHELSVPPTNLVTFILIVLPLACDVCAHISFAGTLLLYMALRSGKVGSQINVCVCHSRTGRSWVLCSKPLLWQEILSWFRLIPNT